MLRISFKDESWFPGFYWTVRQTLNKHLKRSLPSQIGMWEGPWGFCLKWSGYRDSLTRNKVGFPWSGLNAGSSFIWQDEEMAKSCVETLEKAIGLRLIWTGESHHFDTSRGTQISMLQKVTRPDSFWKWIGIPISLLQLESEPSSPASPPEASVLSCQASFRFLSIITR